MLGEISHRIERSVIIGNKQKALTSTVSTLEPTEDVERFLSKAEAFLLRSDPNLATIEFHYGCWLMRAKQSDSHVEIFELNQTTGEYVLDITRSIRYRRLQVETCENNGASFDPPSINSYCAISEGVLDGLDVEGIRYPSPEHMSGWYLTTGLYNGAASSLRVEHLYHICSQRPELVRFFSLPTGFGFSQQGSIIQVYFDEDVAQSEPNP